MTKWFLVLALLFLVGCGKSLRPDPSLPATQANYPTAEFTACGQLWHGLGVCRLDRGKPLADVGLRIQGYYNGTVRIVSSDCYVDDPFRYENSANVAYALPGIAENSCTISFVVTPEYPGQTNQAVAISSFKGHLYVRVSEPTESWSGFRGKVPVSGSLQFPLQLKTETGKVRVIVRGCGSKFDAPLDVSNHTLNIDLATVLQAAMKQTTCIAQGIVYDGSEDHYFSILVAGYNPVFVPLSSPTIELDGGRARFLADPVATVISLDSMAVIGRKAVFKFAEGSPHVARVLTTAGRSVVGLWSPETKTWNWIK